MGAFRNAIISMVESRLDSHASAALWAALSSSTQAFLNGLVEKYGWHKGDELPLLNPEEDTEMRRLAFQYIAKKGLRN
jgi:hypothetical protein